MTGPIIHTTGIGLTGVAASTAATAAPVTAVGAAFTPAVVGAKVIGTMVDVEEKATVVSTIFRGGVEVTAPALDTRKVEDLAGRLVPLVRTLVPRALSQSIPAGTRVARGTPVDLVFVPVRDIDFGLFDKVHADLLPRTVEGVLPLLSDPAVATALAKTSAQDLTDAEKTAFTARLSQDGITVNDADPARTLDEAFSSLRQIRVFQ